MTMKTPVLGNIYPSDHLTLKLARVKQNPCDFARFRYSTVDIWPVELAYPVRYVAALVVVAAAEEELVADAVDNLEWAVGLQSLEPVEKTQNYYRIDEWGLEDCMRSVAAAVPLHSRKLAVEDLDRQAADAIRFVARKINLAADLAAVAVVIAEVDEGSRVFGESATLHPTIFAMQARLEK